MFHWTARCGGVARYYHMFYFVTRRRLFFSFKEQHHFDEPGDRWQSHDGVTAGFDALPAWISAVTPSSGNERAPFGRARQRACHGMSYECHGARPGPEIAHKTPPPWTGANHIICSRLPKRAPPPPTAGARSSARAQRRASKSIRPCARVAHDVSAQAAARRKRRRRRHGWRRRDGTRRGVAAAAALALSPAPARTLTCA